jgi:hypothetical protein
MIFEDVRTALESLSGQLTQLATALHQLAEDVEREGTLQAHEAARRLRGIATVATGQSDGVGTSAAAVDTQQDLQAALQFGVTALGNERAALLAQVRTPFDNEARALPPSGDRTLCDRLLAATDDFIEAKTQEFAEAGSFPVGPSYNVGRLRSTVDDLASYPILTSDGSAFPSMGGRGGGGGYGGTTAVGQSVQRTVEASVRQVLGRLPRYTDSKAFVAALTASFQLTESQGHTVATWRPRGYVGQTELGGGVSGAQASLYARAREALSASLPILKGLRPLRPDADLDEVEAARSMIETQFSALVEELGTEGGPRAPRVDEILSTLLVEDVVGIENQVSHGGLIGYLRDVAGFDAAQVNTIDEEQVLSSFILVRDYVTTVRDSWLGFLAQFRSRDLGTRLVLLSNALQVVAESVDEVVAALDSVFVGSAEQTVARFSIGGGQTMLVSELLTWISSFASQEAPELVQQGGRRAMGPVTTTASRLVELAGRLLAAINSDVGLPEGMRHPRVRHPLTELRTYLGQVIQLAQDVRTA